MIIALLLPIGALLNALTLLTLTSMGISFSLLSVLIANIGYWLMFIISVKPYLKRKSLNIVPRSKLNLISKISLVIIAMTSLYAVSHSVLPTFHYDSTTNWNIRSKVSYYRAELVFDGQEGLIEKPQYPVLYHALQVSAMQLMPEWNEPVANGIHVLLITSLFTAIYLLLRERSFNNAITTFALVLGLPLLSIHTGGSYADLPLIGYALVSLLLFARYVDSNHASDLLLSGIMVTACVWTKSEGLFFCLVPWLVMVAATRRRPPLYPLLWTVTISLLWPVYVVLNGYALTPHGANDATVEVQSTALNAMTTALFASNSFGVFWYALIAVLMLAVRYRKYLIAKYSPTLVWGLLSMTGYLAVYLLTSNAQYLILGQSFDRQMLLPAALLILSFSLLFSENDSVVLR